jgi:hypothetical protein
MADTGRILVSAHFCWAAPVTETKLPQGNICPPFQPESKDKFTAIYTGIIRQRIRNRDIGQDPTKHRRYTQATVHKDNKLE